MSEVQERIVETISSKLAARRRSAEDVIEAVCEEVLDEIVDYEEDVTEDDVRKIVERETASAFRAQADKERAWTEATDCDKLDWVFEYLEATGIAARQDYTCCQTCGTSEIVAEMREAKRPYFGYVYYHMQDTDGAAEGGSLYVAFGASDDHTESDLRVARRFVKVARAAGFQPDWSGDIRKRICVPLVWRRRVVSEHPWAPPAVPAAKYRPLGAEDD